MSISQNFSPIKPSLNLDFSNTKTLDPRITFSRPTGAVYYDGKSVTKAEENLFSYSQEFDNAYWRTFSTATKTSNATTAPDGTLTADELTVVSTTNNVFYSANFSSLSGDYSGSFYLKPSTGSQWVLFALTRGDASVNGVRVWVDLVNGVIGTSNALNSGVTGATLLSASVEVSSNGFYRVRLSGNFSGNNLFVTTQISLVDADASTDLTNQDGNSIYLWGAQLEQRSTVTAYTPTTTQPITNYIPTLLSAPANTARFDHDPVTGESLGLLVEEQRTNLYVRSEDFQTTWLPQDVTVTANTVVAPDGTLTAKKLIPNTANAVHRVSQSGLGTAGAYTQSCYMKAGELSWGVMRIEGINSFFNLSNGTLGVNGLGNTSTITDVGNGWYRCTATRTLSGAMGSTIGVASSDNVDTFAGDGYSGIYIWGAQLEAGSFPTSYIKTEASQVTRSADSASMTGANFSDWYRQDEGTCVTQADTIPFNGALSGALPIIDINDGTTTNLFGLRFDTGGTNTSMLMVISNASQGTIGLFNAISGQNKLSGNYGNGDRVGSLNSATVKTGTYTGSLSVDRMQIGSNSSGNYLNGTIKRIAYYPQRLSNENLQALTS